MRICAPIVHLVMAGMILCLFDLSPAIGGNYAQGPFPYTHESTSLQFTAFNQSSGFLHSVTYIITNIDLAETIVVDNDLPFGVGISTSFCVPYYFTVALISSHPAFSDSSSSIVNTNGSQYVLQADDGDGGGSRNGGPDEADVSSCFTGSCCDSSFGSTYSLNAHTGTGDITGVLWPVTYVNGLGVGKEVYRTNLAYSLDVIVRYEYEDYPRTPEFISIVVSDAVPVMVLGCTSVGSTNTVLRSEDMVHWTIMQAFTNYYEYETWSDPSSEGQAYAFYGSSCR